jgi:hypothetical protein
MNLLNDVGNYKKISWAENYLTFKVHASFVQCACLMLIRSKTHVQIVDCGLFV